MEQPRFGGVALPPLSWDDGEGKYAESSMDNIERKTVDQLGCPQVKMDGNEDDKEKSLQASDDTSVQEVMVVLQELDISVNLERHWLKHERQSNAGFNTSSQGVYCKNLLLKDKKGQAYLIICSEDDFADLQVVRYHLNSTGNLHFASRESLRGILQVQPGAVTPLALIHPSACGVRVFIDASLMKKIDRNSTKLFFHPLVPELQVGLTLAQLEKFLSHCGAALETLPSLVSYSLGRKYNFSTAGSRFKQMDRQESPGSSIKEKPQTEEAEEPKMVVTEECTDKDAHQPDNLAQYASLFRKLGIKIDIIPSNGGGTALIPCRCVYLKDKRNSYFLFICHENQKVDFSNLKTQLKPRKKITPLDEEELSSLLDVAKDREIPFPLARVTQPRFLVATADNLYQREKAVVTFPHPTDAGLSLKITLKDLEIFLRGVDHDLTTIPVKGTLESLLASSPSAMGASPAPLPTNTEKPLGKASLTATPELFPSSSVIPNNSPTPPASLKGNLFYQMTSPLRDWVIRWLSWFIRLLDRYLPYCVSTKLHRSVLCQRLALTGPGTEQREDQPSDGEQQERKWREREAKIAKLRQLVDESGMTVDMEEILESEETPDQDTEQCKTFMLLSAKGRPYLMLCPEDDCPPQNLGRLRTAFRSRGALKPADEADISLLLSWQEGEITMSWTPDELTPLALFQLDLNTLGRVRVGVQADIYSFPDTTITFHQASLGVRLHINYDDLESRLKRQGFCIVYLP